MKYSTKWLIAAAILGSLALAIAIGPVTMRRNKKTHASLNKNLVSEEEEHQQHNVTRPRAQATTQIPLKNKTRDEAMQIWWERRQMDKQADWKVPIRFDGRVVDQDMRPVARANVEFEWTDASPHGTSKQNTMSDENGLFSLTGVRGKNLGVRISKEGYLAAKDVRSRDFEFADPAESTYYEPDSDHPVLFQLRKKGQGAELLKKSVEVVLPGDGSSKPIELTTGKAQP